MTELGTIYLLHYERPLAHAQHYLGWTSGSSVEERIEQHRRGHGAVLTSAFFNAGIRFTLARTWANVSRRDERYLKDLKSARTRLCPICCGRTPRVRRLECQE